MCLSLACSDPTPTPDAGPICGSGFLGDSTKDIDFEFRVLAVDGTDTALKDGDVVPLILPPQGGRVVFVGVRATNIDPCGVQLSGAMRDTVNLEVRIDSRTVNLNPDGTGWGTSGLPSQTVSAARSNYSNIPLCPNQWSQSDVFGTSYELDVTLTDKAKRTVTKTIHVTPSCAEPDKLAECLCICKLGYILGESCATDGGSDQ